MVVLPCEAFDNFPPGLPGKLATLAVRIPGGVTTAARQLRIGWLRRLPMLWGRMVTTSVGDPVLDERMRAWTEPVLADARIRRDLVKYARTTFGDAELVRRTEALRDFDGDALVLWAPDNRVMPPEHGPRLAGLLPRGRYAEIRGAAVLSMLDEPEAVAREIGGFLAGDRSRGPG